MANRDDHDEQHRYGQQRMRRRGDDPEWEEDRLGSRGRDERDEEYGGSARHGRMSGWGERARSWSERGWGEGRGGERGVGEGGRGGERGAGEGGRGFAEGRSWSGSGWGSRSHEGSGEREYGGEGEYGGQGYGGERRGLGGGGREAWESASRQERGGWFGGPGGGEYGYGEEGGVGGPGYGGERRGGMGRGGGRFSGRGPKGYERSDDRIREDVCDRLMDAGDLDASSLTVQVSSGEVTLEGSVDSKQAKRRAEDIAEEVSGVREVQNRLRVERGGGLFGEGPTAQSGRTGESEQGGRTGQSGATTAAGKRTS